ncbi:hypothetical protein MASR2M15_23440 [Anaerolineales bacterium]
MPAYDFKCKECGHRFELFFKTIEAYEQADCRCPECQSDQLSRLIQQVSIQQASRDYGKMNSKEMLSVLESGDAKQVDTLFNQVGPSANPQNAAPLHEKVKKAQEKPSSS